MLLHYQLFSLHFLMSIHTHYFRGQLLHPNFIYFQITFHFKQQYKPYNNIRMIEEQDHNRTEAEVKIITKQQKQQNENYTSSINHLDEEEPIKLNVMYCILAILFKIIPIIFFFTITRIKILGFTLVLVAAAIDFWTYKNITGKKLVGLIWWMNVNPENGEEEWVFHSNQGYSMNNINEGVFWGSNLAWNVFWGISTLLSIILSSLFWIALCALCLILGVINFYYFLKCQGGHQQKMKNIADQIGLASAHRLVDY